MENLFNNVKPKSKELYISNIRRLRNGLQNLPLNNDTAIDIESLDFLQDVDKVLTYLTTKYAPTTVRSYFIAISSMLNELPKYKNLYNRYYKILMEQNKSLDRNNSKSETQKENWISQDDVLEKQKEYEAKAKEVINLFGEGSRKWRPKEWNVILDWVIISLYTLLPPRRLIDYSEMNVVTDTSLDVDEEMNYFVKSKKRFIFTNYKTAGTYKTQVTPVPDELDTILQTYLDLRKDKDTNDIPLLITATGEPIRENYTITKHLNKIFGKKVSVNMLRNIYLTTNFKDNLTNLKETATLMGTSPETIQNHYVKLDEDFPAIEPKNKGLTIRKTQRLEEATPPTEPTDKKIKINRTTKLEEATPPTEPTDKKITIKRKEEPSKYKINPDETYEEYLEDASTNTYDESESSSDDEPEQFFMREDIEAVKKIYEKMNLLDFTEKDRKKLDKLYAQLDKIPDGVDIMSILDEGEEPNVANPKYEFSHEHGYRPIVSKPVTKRADPYEFTLTAEEQDTYEQLTPKDRKEYDNLYLFTSKKEFLKKTQKKYERAEIAREKKRLKDEKAKKESTAKYEADKKLKEKEKKERIAKLKAEWKEMTPAQQKAWKQDQTTKWKIQFPYDTPVPQFTYWGEISK